MLYATLGQAHDPETGEAMSSQSATEIVDRILGLPVRTKVMLLGPVVDDQRGEFRDVLERLVHSCGDPGIAPALRFSPGACAAGLRAVAGKPGEIPRAP